MSRRGTYRGRRFRSLMEYSFYKHLEGNGVALGDILYEAIRIPYRVGRRVRGYLPDFVVGDRVYEVKPVRRQRGRVFVAKTEAAREYCLRHGLKFLVVSELDFRVRTLREARQDPHVRISR